MEPTAPVVVDQRAAEDAVIADIVSRMSLERKVAQLIQPQINSFTAEDMERYRFGSYLNGGNGGPYGDEFAEGPEWLRLADEMWDASTRPLEGDEPVIPTMWGTDAVHGHTNVVRATIFPHNIALGATHDPNLVRLIGAATATEIEVTGIDWNFSPTVAVARDDRWGRTYESYSEDPRLVARMGAALVEGLQGKPGDEDWLRRGRVVATAKHFFGDGGTAQGVDQGEVKGDIAALKAIHAVPYPAAIDAGVQSIMASFNSINGKKMHGHKELLDDYLRGELGFDGLVVGDWNGHGQVAGCTVTDCAQAINAGLDIYMVPDDWKGLMDTLTAQVGDGTVSMARIDEAVSRVLRVKYRAGLLDENALKPSARPNAGEWEKLGFAPHRAVAREAVAKSQVILKNDGVLPIKDGADILVAGKAADSIAQASGGWTLTWQGGGELTNANFPGATSIWAGIEEAASAAGGSATYAPDGNYADEPDVAIVVFGEEPYAEFAGDRKNLAFPDEEGLNLLRKFDAAGIPTVAVFLSGRPLWMNREMNASNAFVASWLPGSEGAGVADILFGKREATGKLSFSWPATCEGNPLNGPEGALFAFGYGRSLDDASPTPMLDENCAALTEGAAADWYVNGRLADGVLANTATGKLDNLRGTAGGITATGLDRNAQEDARQIRFAPGASFDLQQQGGSSGIGYRIAYEVLERPTAPVVMRVGGETVDITHQLSVAAGKGWREMIVTEACAADLGPSIGFASQGAFTMRIGTVVREEFAQGTDCSF
ncbi:exo 1,3/1,4-beta-D-glucan glucohydrolase [Sphingomicrobium sp. B8]|uniref:Exo 1,3/1,4-beta-D-glucan glucohydrolase n=2 Tax=Sphingomicrobium clamense TaxID=2851013 RepID=A0ABS6V2Q3_9SPHN|nr:exo 1,3/1,4-beta-D-glucan glucohydrolase [Sphingomicrobium sp. B8]